MNANTAKGSLTMAQIKATAQDWYERQVERARVAHGGRWTSHQGWVDAYIREELRQRLVARGWVARHV